MLTFQDKVKRFQAGLPKHICPKCGENITGCISHSCYDNGQSFTKFRKELLK